jgi:ubiquinone/menaquinone biosynthesis C-methylase UbiE
MSDKETAKIRKEILAGVSGDVFELGFGTGLNLPHYPCQVRKLVTADPNPGMRKAAKDRIANSPIEVDCRVLGGEALPFDDESFDTVVCTWTLCSIPDADRALAHCYRMLRPGGKFLFVEHGLADDSTVRKWQARLNPFWSMLGDGCHLDRNIKKLIMDSKLQIEKLENFYMPGASRFSGYMYQGVATKA